MSIARLSRDRKRQLGQFLTPASTAAAIVGSVDLSPEFRILEPSFGEGSFVFAMLDSISMSIPHDQLGTWCESHLYGCEIDNAAYNKFTGIWKSRGLGQVPPSFEHCDFFTWMPPGRDRKAALNRQAYFDTNLAFFDLVIGNPPFGGSINPSIQDELDSILGVRNGRKIKKETYAFFIVKCLDHLKPGGRLVFICSDTLLTIMTMSGLRSWLQANCEIQVSEVTGTFAETKKDMVLLNLIKRETPSSHLTVFGRSVPLAEIEVTPNMSWRVDSESAKYFTGFTLGDKMIATSGMTTGNNKLFLRQVQNATVLEPYEFTFIEQPITVEREVARARLGKMSPRRMREIEHLEACGATEKTIAYERLATPRPIALPHEDYCLYNKATSQIIFSDPKWVIFWRRNGEYVYTYKKTGNWYLRGVGGKKYFGREGLTWALIAPRLCARYLPSGYILDSGAPSAFLRDGVEHDELFFIHGWALTDMCNYLLKNVLNHTRNIQSKDFERLPYPIWVDAARREVAILVMRDLVSRAQAGKVFTFRSKDVRQLNSLYEWRDCDQVRAAKVHKPLSQVSLF